MYKYFDDWLDDYFLNDDAYFVVQQYVNNEVKYYKEDDDDFYTADDDGRRLGQVEAGEGKQIEVRQFRAAEGELEVRFCLRTAVLFVVLFYYIQI